MQNYQPLFRRTLRRVGIFLLLIVVLATEVFAWFSEKASILVHLAVKAFGLSHAEEWLKERSVWFALFLVVPMGALFAAFEAYKWYLVFHGHIVLAEVLGLGFKVVWFATMNYLMHLYGEKLLALNWILWAYMRYQDSKEWVHAYLESFAIYRKVQALKRHTIALLRRKSLLAVARRWRKNSKEK